MRLLLARKPIKKSVSYIITYLHDYHSYIITVTFITLVHYFTFLLQKKSPHFPCFPCFPQRLLLLGGGGMATDG